MIEVVCQGLLCREDGRSFRDKLRTKEKKAGNDGDDKNGDGRAFLKIQIAKSGQASRNNWSTSAEPQCDNGEGGWRRRRSTT